MAHDNRSPMFSKGAANERGYPHSSSHSIPRVTLSSFGRSKFTWLLQEAWGEEDFSDYLEFSQNQGWNPFRNIDHSKKEMRNLGQPVGKWLLKDDQGHPIAGAEALIAETGFSRLSVNLFMKDDEPYPRLPEAFSYLVSALFLITSSDVVSCMVAGGDLHQLLRGFLDVETLQQDQQLGGNLRSIMAARSEVFVCDDDWSIPLKTMHVWEVTPGVWWETEQAKKDRADLKYLEKRIDNEQRLEQLTRRSRRRMRPFSLFARLFSWRG